MFLDWFWKAFSLITATGLTHQTTQTYILWLTGKSVADVCPFMCFTTQTLQLSAHPALSEKSLIIKKQHNAEEQPLRMHVYMT